MPAINMFQEGSVYSKKRRIHELANHCPFPRATPVSYLQACMTLLLADSISLLSAQRLTFP